MPRPPFLEMSFRSTEKTAEAVEMELVVCRCMREWDYPSIMSALLNTITLYRSERDLKRIYCLLICVCVCENWDYMLINESFLKKSDMI